MACITLKRPLSLNEHPFEPHNPGVSVHHRPPPSKRRRCGTQMTREYSRDRYEASLLRRRQESSPSPSSSSSPFRESQVSPEEIAKNLRDELKRLRKRRQIATGRTNVTGSGSAGPSCSPPSSPEPMMDDVTALRTATLALSSPLFPNSSQKPIFTLKQMTLICERMCKERTDQLRDEYDKILQQKLSEQYDAFVKFIDHQLQARFNQSQLPSYLS